MASLSCWASLSKLGVGILYFRNLGDVLLVPLQFACDSTLASLNMLVIMCYLHTGENEPMFIISH